LPIGNEGDELIATKKKIRMETKERERESEEKSQGGAIEEQLELIEAAVCIKSQIELSINVRDQTAVCCDLIGPIDASDV
jgi:hypothetical protein